MWRDILKNDELEKNEILMAALNRILKQYPGYKITNSGVSFFVSDPIANLRWHFDDLYRDSDNNTFSRFIERYFEMDNYTYALQKVEEVFSASLKGLNWFLSELRRNNDLDIIISNVFSRTKRMRIETEQHGTFVIDLDTSCNTKYEGPKHNVDYLMCISPDLTNKPALGDSWLTLYMTYNMISKASEDEVHDMAYGNHKGRKAIIPDVIYLAIQEGWRYECPVCEYELDESDEHCDRCGSMVEIDEIEGTTVDIHEGDGIQDVGTVTAYWSCPYDYETISDGEYCHEHGIRLSGWPNEGNYGFIVGEVALDGRFNLLLYDNKIVENPNYPEPDPEPDNDHIRDYLSEDGFAELVLRDLEKVKEILDELPGGDRFILPSGKTLLTSGEITPDEEEQFEEMERIILDSGIEGLTIKRDMPFLDSLERVIEDINDNISAIEDTPFTSEQERNEYLDNISDLMTELETLME